MTLKGSINASKFIAFATALTAGACYVIFRFKDRRNRERRGATSPATKLLYKYKQQLTLTPSQITKLDSELQGQIRAGLKAEITTNGLHMLMLPTCVSQIPNGEETGDIYAIDVGGTNFRVKYVRLSAEKSKIESEENFEAPIPKDVMTGTGSALFDFIATRTLNFIMAHEGGQSLEPPLVGFCFSFAIKQLSFNRGILLDWTKGFTCSDVIGHDPVQLLHEAFERAGRQCRVMALLNDTVGVLSAHRYLDQNTCVGIIIGTGTNAAYVEKIGSVKKWSAGPDVDPNAHTIINTEWGAFDSSSLPRCEEDWEVDAATIHKGKYLFEKLLSGMYIGDVARRILLRMARDPSCILFGSKASSDPLIPVALTTKEGFPTSALAKVVEDPGMRPETMARILGVATMSVEACDVVSQVCHLVAERSAQLIALALCAILRHTGWVQNPEGPLTVAFDGGMYEQFAAYRTMIRKAVDEFLGASLGAKITLELVHDGSCVGAAVLAAAATLEHQN
ncbi:hypothetical protein CEUSTIGMA_g1606.t1 [Chlamydomonas eustigma]|uniref:Phosphotransferase n=1 Tax=Chlamydomonas eustigma TaxID=1157962 RepID=A0A250WTK3_9CHLO|nr:hypothetical protein CEUSTIGMA_g1606.t1 [Chlamydomonas eustigma]|eukprot:GAX74157.1 hypothetical protein CEUSTIGMA_g1606.t1 [Chlamydomonas eustigma]